MHARIDTVGFGLPEGIGTAGEALLSRDASYLDLNLLLTRNYAVSAFPITYRSFNSKPGMLRIIPGVKSEGVTIRL